MFQRILVPTDFSASATLATQLARSNFPGAEVRLLHVIDDVALSTPLDSPAGVTGPAVGMDDQMPVYEAEAREQLAAVGGGEIAYGNPAGATLEAARRLGADLIVMGTHGPRGLERLLFGSVAERVVRESTIPVLTVRAPERR